MRDLEREGEREGGKDVFLFRLDIGQFIDWMTIFSATYSTMSGNLKVDVWKYIITSTPY